ncbi:MAG: AAA family ATPase [Kiritimatiellales bacterium]
METNQETAGNRASHPEASERANINISADKIKQTLHAKVQEKEIEQIQADLIWWFYCYCKEQDFSLGEAGKQIGKDSTTIHRIFHCAYGAKLDNICADIARYKRIVQERAGQVKLDFVETSIAKIIWRACDGALISQSVAFIYGDPQIGKTMALEEYARRNNHGQTKLIRMPASAGVQLFTKEMARACFVSVYRSFEGMRDSILNAVDDKTLIIIDEAHQCFLSYQKGSQIKVLELIREIYDRTHCGLVLCGTNVWRREIQEGKLASMLEQLRRRGTIKIQLPSKPPKADLDRIAKKFGLAPAEDLALEVIKEMLHTSGLGMVVKYLQNASRMASRENKKLSWDHFVQAHDIIQKLSIKGE